LDAIKDPVLKDSTPAEVVNIVADILEDEVNQTIKDWLQRVDADELLLTISMDDKARSCHLPRLFEELVYRLRNPLELGERRLVSTSAAKHGTTRRHQGYSAAMLVDESRLLQVSIFLTLHNNVHRIDANLLLLSVMTIADEIDSQLAEAMTSFITESIADAQPIEA
jgi:hypothetical protein